MISGPMPGNVELRSARVWAELHSKGTASLQYWAVQKPDVKRTAFPSITDTLGFRTVIFTLGALEPATQYEYRITVTNDKNQAPSGAVSGQITTKDLWQWRKPAPDFSFLTGSCSYVNEPVYDRPGKPYGGDSSIFETMARTPASFMLWLGDNWYYREVDYYDPWGLHYRASHDRSQPILQNFLKAMPHYAIWDDHDYGPNDADKSYPLKETARDIFKQYWLNPSFGENGQGIYTRFSYGDVDFICLDDRWWRSSDDMEDTLNQMPNPEKRMFGYQQMDWLKNALLSSKATFKIIVTGSQVINMASPFDCFYKFPAEYYELMEFLRKERVNGVVFFTGDRHHSEIIKLDRPGTYPLYEVTVSPLTSGTHKFGGPEKDNPFRVFGLDEKQNFGRVSVTGPSNKRKLSVEFLGITGEKLLEWSISETDLKSPQQ